MAICYGLGSVNIYTYEFTFYTKSGLNVKWWLNRWFNLNMFSLIIFVLLAFDWYRKNQEENLDAKSL